MYAHTFEVGLMRALQRDFARFATALGSYLRRAERIWSRSFSAMSRW
jgi:hypothetical protein